MEKKGSSLSELREAGATRKIMKAQVVTRLALDEVKNTSRVLRERVIQARVHGLAARRPVAVDRTVHSLPRAFPIFG
jgi:hypothetical protein